MLMPWTCLKVCIEKGNGFRFLKEIVSYVAAYLTSTLLIVIGISLKREFMHYFTVSSTKCLLVDRDTGIEGKITSLNKCNP